MRLMTTFTATAMSLSLSAPTQAETLTSGPQVDERVSTFSVEVASGPRVGRRRGTG